MLNKAVLAKGVYLKKVIEDIGIRLLNPMGMIPARAVPHSALIELLRALRPVETEHPLIRVGAKADGGYLVPDDLEGISACFSPGVSTCSDFEKDCADRGMDVFLADRSVDGPATSHPRFHFTPKYVGAFSDDDFMTMSEWMTLAQVDSRSDLLLQMDIEGFEFETIFNMPQEQMNRFRIMVFEFHYLPEMWVRSCFLIMSRVFKKILQTHACVHTHPNNVGGAISRLGIEMPWCMEMTFLRRDRFSKNRLVTTFPHPLDADNTNHKPLVLHESWYKD